MTPTVTFCMTVITLAVTRGHDWLNHASRQPSRLPFGEEAMPHPFPINHPIDDFEPIGILIQRELNRVAQLLPNPTSDTTAPNEQNAA